MLTALRARAAVACRPAAAASVRSAAPSVSASPSVRCFSSIFGSAPPGDDLASMLRDKASLQSMEPTTGEAVLDKSVPQGAPKPSALNRLRQSGRPGRDASDSAREHAVDLKMRKAMEYKMQREEAKAKAAEEAATKAVQAAREAAAGKK